MEGLSRKVDAQKMGITGKYSEKKSHHSSDYEEGHYAEDNPIREGDLHGHKEYGGLR